ncbi:hypothetical protein [Desulfallas thermosapovorans]|uniref:Uncharacterized protein n=1 Tax=Desulfallas thermosapovorans DSM 6562 TaxID=1121431 RepID=A0A5S4ZPC7_9FIRM|nr:hypothetical protein [Desulfallas thermosapovorans]TYO93930.1 hypothetical protein LX24_02494 [Desulfallas thermosapovorans DSM 6562]
MYRTSKEHIQLIVQRIKEALREMDKKYGFTDGYFDLMQIEIDAIAANLDTLSIFSKMNIESLTKLIDILKEHVKTENNQVIKEDLNNLINALEKELAKKIKELN